MKKKFPILDINVSPLTYQRTLNIVAKLIENKKKAYLCVSAVHLIMECQKNLHLKKIVNNAELVTTDGMPLVWWLKWHGFKGIERVYGPNLTLKTCYLAEQRGWKVVFLGGASGQSVLLTNQIEKRYSHLKFWVLDTPQKLQTIEEKEKALTFIHKKKPHIVFVGIGCPLQELWMGENIGILQTDSVLIGVGAAFDFISGKVKQAPIWMQRYGMEWLFRLTQDPIRLWKRYLIFNSIFLIKILKTVYSESR